MPKRLIFPLITTLLLALAGSAAAQWGVPSVVKNSAALEPASAKRGAEVTLTVTAEVDSEYHLYAMKQPTDAAGPTPTAIALSDESLKLLAPQGDWKEPKVTVKFDQGFQMEVGTLYGSPLEFTRSFLIRSDIEPGEYEIAGQFTYQACTETSCLPPMVNDFTVKLVVEEGEPVAEVTAPASGADTETDNAASGTATAPPTNGEYQAAATSATEDIVAGSSMGGFIFAAFALGLLALLTPCVFPMIPITITFFTDKSAKTTGHAALNAFIYVISIILGFTIIGLGFSLILRIVGAGVESSGFANAIAANPWINLGFGVLYVVFALSLFELFQIALPTSISSKLNSKAMKGSGAISIFFKAMVFVVISFTCTAPLLGVLIVQALAGSWLRPLFGMMAFSAGFAAPFFFLALAPQMLSKLPRAGTWLYATKVVMGMIVLAASFKFFSNADLILLGESMVLSRELLLAIWAGIAGVVAFYLFGLIRLQDEAVGQGISAPRLMLGTTFAVVALYLASGLFGGRLNLWVEAYMPPDLAAKASGAMASGNAPEEELFDWYEEVEPALAEARRTGRNVFIDFSGYTCTNCRLMEKDMFPRKRVAELMNEYVLVRLYTDDPETGRKWQKYQAEMFNTVALPLYAIVTPDEQIIAKEEYTRSEDQFVAFLQKGLTKEVAIAEP